MSHNNYYLIRNWPVRGTVDEVIDIIRDQAALPQWWPSVYRAARIIESGDEQGMGQVVTLKSRGWLPYTTQWQSRIVQMNCPHSIALEVWGDFVGRATWRFVEGDEWVNVIYDWQVRAEAPLLRYLSPLLKPLFTASQRWGLAQGHRSLRLELLRRRGEKLGLEVENRIPDPPPPADSRPFWLGGAALGLLSLYLLTRLRRTKA